MPRAARTRYTATVNVIYNTNVLVSLWLLTCKTLCTLASRTQIDQYDDIFEDNVTSETGIAKASCTEIDDNVTMWQCMFIVWCYNVVNNCDIDDFIQEERELHPLGRDELVNNLRRKLVKIRRGLTIDSGAADHVIPMNWIKGMKVVPSPGSRRGVHYVAASGQRIPNLGQTTIVFVTTEGVAVKMTFQVADINKPLVSVRRLIKDGWRVVFDEKASFLVRKDSKEVIQLRGERGVYVIDASVNEGFMRQS